MNDSLIHTAGFSIEPRFGQIGLTCYHLMAFDYPVDRES